MQLVTRFLRLLRGLMSTLNSFNINITPTCKIFRKKITVYGETTGPFNYYSAGHEYLCNFFDVNVTLFEVFVPENFYAASIFKNDINPTRKGNFWLDISSDHGDEINIRYLPSFCFDLCHPRDPLANSDD